MIYLLYKRIMKLFIADLNQIINNGDFLSTAKSKLLPEDLHRFNAYFHSARAMQFLVGRFLVATYISPNYQTLSSGKVTVPNGYISIAHSKNFVVLAASESPVGVDIEAIDLKRNHKKIADRMKFKNAQSPLEFFKLWTAYEADYKLGQPQIKPVHTYIEHFGFLICTATPMPEDIEKIDCML